MAQRTIVNAIRLANRTDIVLDCGHRRSLGGHVYQGRSRSKEELIGMHYDCQDDYCLRIDIRNR